MTTDLVPELKGFSEDIFNLILLPWIRFKEKIQFKQSTNMSTVNNLNQHMKLLEV